MPALPDRPNLDQLRHRAKDLLRAAHAGGAEATARIHAVSDRLTLATAQLAIAREYGFSSWPALRSQVEARTLDLQQKVDAFCVASIGGSGALRMLFETPQIETYNFATAVLLGNVDRVREEIERDPRAATRRDQKTGWTPLEAVSASRWHSIDPTRADNLVAVAALLIDAGADVNGRRPNGWTTLRCAVAGKANPGITKLLLERGAVPDDHDVYLACFGDDDHQSLRHLLEYVADISETTSLSAPISTGDTEASRILLEAGADARKPLPGDLFGSKIPVEPLIPPVVAAVESDAPLELIELLLRYGADPDAPGQDGLSPYRQAMRRGKVELLELLRSHGARPQVTDIDRFLCACRLADSAEMRNFGPDLAGQLDEKDYVVLVEAAAEGRTESVRLMLDAGFPIETRGDDGGTALHAASYAGSASTVQLLLERGADLESRDTTWDSTPIDWVKVGSGHHPDHCPDPDWVATARILIEAGASLAELNLGPDSEKPASGEVDELLRSYGVS